jgi:hypothetical protein
MNNLRDLSLVELYDKHPEALAWRSAQMTTYCETHTFVFEDYAAVSKATWETMYTMIERDLPFVIDLSPVIVRGQHYTWQEFNALPDDTPQPKGSESWPQDALHGRVKDVLKDMKQVVPAARQALRQSIDGADAGPQGREKSDQALGRALRFK